MSSRLIKKFDRYLSSVSEYLWWAKFRHVNSHGKPLSFVDRPFLIDLYKNLSKEMVVIKSVQVGLSELFVVATHLEAAKGLSVMYILPTLGIRSRFVHSRIHTLHKRTDFMRSLCREAKGMGGTSNVGLISFGKGVISYVSSNSPQELTEFPADSVFIDEYDRCNQKNILLAPDRLEASEYRYFRRAGNPTITGFGIDDQYTSSTQGSWFIRCEACGHWFEPDFFIHVVRQLGSTKYEPLDTSGDESRDFRMFCDKCSRPVNRFYSGEWVHTYMNRRVMGFRVSQLFIKTKSLRDLVDDWDSSVGDVSREQVFVNNRLGRAYSHSLLRITKELLDDCRYDYIFPQHNKLDDVMRVMGVDVGSVMHYVVRDLVGDIWRLVDIGEAQNFNDLSRVIKTLDPSVCVIDRFPETHAVEEIKKQFKSVYDCSWVMDKPLGVDKTLRSLKIDRTVACDGLKHLFDSRLFAIPQNDIANGIYYSHMQASARILDIDADRYVWREGSKPDHYFFAEVYCSMACRFRPKFHNFLSFYDKQLAGVSKRLDTKNSAVVLESFGNKPIEVRRNVDEGKSESDIMGEIRNVFIDLLDSGNGKIKLVDFCARAGILLDVGMSFLSSNDMEIIVGDVADRGSLVYSLKETNTV